MRTAMRICWSATVFYVLVCPLLAQQSEFDAYKGLERKYNPFSQVESCPSIDPRVLVTKEEIFGGLVPAANRFVSVSLSCDAQIRARIEQYVKEDEAYFRSWLNRACSAKFGWVEIQPGTCTAGGPPPVLCGKSLD